MMSSEQIRAATDARVREIQTAMAGLTYAEKCTVFGLMFERNEELTELNRTLRWRDTWQRMLPPEDYEFEVIVRVEPAGPELEVAPADEEIDPEIEGNTNPTLRIGNLSTASDRKKLMAAINEVFSKHGAIRDVNLPMDMATGNPRGFAFIEFRDPRDAMRAFKAENGSLKIGGRDIRVEMARSARKTTDEMASLYGARPTKKTSSVAVAVAPAGEMPADE